LEAAERGFDEMMTRFIAWAARYGVDVDGARDARMKLRFHGTEGFRDRVRAIKEGLKVWTDAGMDPVHFREAQVRFDDGSFCSACRWLNV
jgi:hypothetical protein